MRLYVETNFILELAFLREEHEECSTLLELADGKRVELVLPAFCIGEAYEVIHRRRKDRIALQSRLNREVEELARSRPYSESPAEFRKLMALLVHSGEEESARLNEALGMLLGSTILIPLDSPIARSALALQESRGLSPQDSIVFASILSDLSGDPPDGPHGFATKDTDFLTPDVRGDLAALDCRLFTRFNHGLSYYRSRA